MIHDEVHTAAYAVLVTLGGEGFKILHSAQLGLDLMKIRYGVAAVAAILGALEQRHQMDIVDPAFFYIVDLRPHALKVAAEIIHIQHHADELIGAVPVRVLLALAVERLQGAVALVIKLIDGVAQPEERLHIVVVDLAVKPLELVIAALEAVDEFLFPFSAFIHEITSKNNGLII